MPYSVNVSISVLTLYILTSVSVFPSCSLLISQGADKENLLNNQELFCYWSFLLFPCPLMFNSGVILLGETTVNHSKGSKGYNVVLNLEI